MNSTQEKFLEAEKSLKKQINLSLKDGYVHTDNFNIHYITCGEGEPLLLIHGLNAGWGQWYSNIEYLSKHHKVIAVDMPGTGLSTKINVTKANFDETYVKTIEEFVGKLKLSNINLVGHSLGAWIIFKLALRNNISINKFAVTAPVGVTDIVPWWQKPLSIYLVVKILTTTVERPSYKNIEKFICDVFYNKKVINKDFLRYYFHSIQNGGYHPFFLLNRFLKNFRINKDLVLIDELKHIKQRGLVILGENDPLVNYTQALSTSQSLPNTEVVSFKECGHVPPIEKSSEFNKTLISFFNNNK